MAPAITRTSSITFKNTVVEYSSGSSGAQHFQCGLLRRAALNAWSRFGSHLTLEAWDQWRLLVRHVVFDVVVTSIDEYDDASQLST